MLKIIVLDCIKVTSMMTGKKKKFELELKDAKLINYHINESG